MEQTESDQTEGEAEGYYGGKKSKGLEKEHV